MCILTLREYDIMPGFILWSLHILLFVLLSVFYYLYKLKIVILYTDYWFTISVITHWVFESCSDCSENRYQSISTCYQRYHKKIKDPMAGMCFLLFTFYHIVSTIKYYINDRFDILFDTIVYHNYLQTFMCHVMVRYSSLGILSQCPTIISYLLL